MDTPEDPNLPKTPESDAETRRFSEVGQTVLERLKKGISPKLRQIIGVGYIAFQIGSAVMSPVDNPDIILEHLSNTNISGSFASASARNSETYLGNLSQPHFGDKPPESQPQNSTPKLSSQT